MLESCRLHPVARSRPPSHPRSAGRGHFPNPADPRQQDHLSPALVGRPGQDALSLKSDFSRPQVPRSRSAIQSHCGLEFPVVPALLGLQSVATLTAKEAKYERIATDIGGHSTPPEQEIRTTTDLRI